MSGKKVSQSARLARGASVIACLIYMAVIFPSLMVFLFMMMVTIMFIVHLDEVLGADEAVPLFVKHSESFSDVALDVRVLELPLMEER